MCERVERLLRSELGFGVDWWLLAAFCLPRWTSIRRLSTSRSYGGLREDKTKLIEEPMMLVPQKLELTTQQAAALLNVSRPFVIKEIEAGRLKCRLINRHRRIEFEELMRYKDEQKQRSASALKRLNDLSQEMGEEL